MFVIRSMFAALRGRRAPAPGAYERGLVAFDTGHNAEALAEFRSALEETGAAHDRARAHNKRGVVLIALARREEALEAFGLALGSDERFAPALVNVGNLLLEDGYPLDAVDYYEAALRSDERYALASRNLGAAFKRLNRPAEAVRALRSAARFEARHPGRA